MNNTQNDHEMTRDDFTILSKETVYQGYFRMAKYCLKFKLYSGGWSEPITREVFERGNSVAVLLFDPVLEQVVLVEQFRTGCLNNESSPWTLELVAGSLATDEIPRALAVREAQEEAGCDISNLIEIADVVVSPGGCSEKVTIFVANVDSSHAGGIHGLKEEHEDIRVIVKKVDEAYELIKSGKITTASTIIALQWLQLNYQQVRDKFLQKIDQIP